jgi:hypothetical protein
LSIELRATPRPRRAPLAADVAASPQPQSIPLRLDLVRWPLCTTGEEVPIAIGEDFDYRTSRDTFFAVRCPSCRNLLVDLRAGAWLINRFGLASPGSLAAFTMLGGVQLLLGRGELLWGELRRPESNDAV